MPSTTVYQLKITLVDRVSIWRRVQVVDDTTLAELHRILQVVMGWENYHLHRFYIYNFGELDEGRESAVTMAQLGLGEAGGSLGYEYDFGDGWQHEIRVEKILPLQPGRSYPVCLSGRRACPPEDVGGIWGYAEFLRARKNRHHPDYYHYKEWIGSKFDPEAFSVESVNHTLRTSQRPAGEAPETPVQPELPAATTPPDKDLIALAEAVIAYLDDPEGHNADRLREQMEEALDRLPRRVTGRSRLHQLARAVRTYCEKPTWTVAYMQASRRMERLADALRGKLAESADREV